MAVSTSDSTSITLLAKLRNQPADAGAWDEFVRRYRPRIYAFCVSWPLQTSDAEDVTQNVLLKLVKVLREFQYDPAQSFRAWLRQVTRNALNDYLSERQQAHRGSGDLDVLRLLQDVQARDGLVQQIEVEFDHELLDIALRRVRDIVSEQRWNAFRLTALEGKPAADVAAELGMLVATVYTAKSKVQKLVRDEIAQLERRMGDGAS